MSVCLGIDVGASAVKIAAIRFSYRKTALIGLVSRDVAPGADLPAVIREAVKALLGEKGGMGDACAVALEGSKAAFVTVSLPQSATKALASVLPFELEPVIPFDMAESVFDYRVLPPSTDAEKSPTISVLCAVAPTADVRARIDLVKSATGVEPERVGVGGFVLANLLGWTPALATSEPTLLLDLGNDSSDLIVLEGGEPVFARTLSLGTKGLPQTAPKLAREVRTTVLGHRAAGGKSPTKVFLAGGGAFVSGAEGFLAGELGLEVVRIPAPTLELEQPGSIDLAEMPRFAKALGLALGVGPRPLGMNLRQGVLSFERGFAWVREKVPLLAGLAIAIFVISLLSAGAQLYAATRERAALEGALGTVTKEVLGESTVSASRATELLAKQTQIADEDPMPHADAFDVMVKLSENIPQSMVHDIEELDIQKGHVIVHGIVGTIPDAQAIMTSLKNEPCFTDVKITRTNQVVGGERQKYVMEFEVKCPEDVRGTPKKGSTAQPTPSASGGK